MMRGFAYISALTALLMFSSCSKSSLAPEISDYTGTISYNAVGAVKTKAGTTAFEQAWTFCSYSFLTADDGTVSPYINGWEVMYFPDEKSPYAADTWHPDATFFWPKSGKMKFYAYTALNDAGEYHPSALPNVSCSYENGISYSYDAIANSNVDVLIADATDVAISGSTETDYASGVPTVFRHTQTQIAFAVRQLQPHYYQDAEQHETSFIVTGITMKNIDTRGTYTQNSSPVWSNQSEAADIAVFSGSAQTDTASVSVGTRNMVVPFGITDSSTFEVRYQVRTWNGTGYVTYNAVRNIPVAGYKATWEVNKKIIYTIIFDYETSSEDPAKNAVITFDPAVQDWTDLESDANIYTHTH